MSHLLTASQLTADDARGLVTRAAELAAGSAPHHLRPVLGTLFLTASLRTRVGFEVAARRLGGSSVAVTELRLDGAMSAAESFPDALRVLSGMVDVVVTRTDAMHTAEHVEGLLAPVVNGGDASEHPTQALIDLAAIERYAGPVAGLHVNLWGDLGMRAATSLARLLRTVGVRRLSGIHPPGRGPVVALERLDVGDVGDVDVLVMIGLPPGTGRGRLSDDERAAYALGSAGLKVLPRGAVVLSPMPVIDELTPAARGDSRLRMFEQSDHGMWVRTAVLESVLAGGTLAGG